MSDAQPAGEKTPQHPLEPAVREALSHVIDPEIHRPITELGMVESVHITQAGVCTVTVLLTVSSCPLRGTLEEDVNKAIDGVEGITAGIVHLGVMNEEQRTALRQQLRGGQPEHEIPFNRPDNLTRIIAVASGKGGVGKSSVTVNLAMALRSLGRTVGVLDADIYGHSIPDMLGLQEARPTMVDDMMLPVPALGLKVISVGMLKPDRHQVVAWRGPILDRALTQLLADVYWGDIDYLVIDLPPGTGDIAMSLGQKLPNAEILVVTTPQAAAADVAERAGLMAGIMEQRVIGVVENMSWLEAECPHCGKTHRIELFGTGGGQTVAESLTERLGYEVPVVAQVPLQQDFREAGDDGVPLVATDPAAPTSIAILDLARSLAEQHRNLEGLHLSVAPV